MVHKTVYLAGPISGLTYGECTAWREITTIALAEYDIKALSPLRAKVYIREMHAGEQGARVDQASSATEEPFVHAMSNQCGITTRDRFDCQNCTVLFVNLLGAKKISTGTVMEIAWADGKRIPIVLVMEDEGNVHDHAMLRECVGFRVPTVSEGVDIVKAILTDY